MATSTIKNAGFYVETKTKTITINANTYQSWNEAVSRTGYTLIGIVGFDVDTGSHSGSTNAVPIKAKTYGNNLLFGIKNNNSSSVTLTLNINLLWAAI